MCGYLNVQCHGQMVKLKQKALFYVDQKLKNCYFRIQIFRCSSQNARANSYVRESWSSGYTVDKRIVLRECLDSKRHISEGSGENYRCV